MKAIVNMSNDKEFHVTGTFDILGSLAGIDISWSVPFDILINVVGKADIELYGVIGEIPTMVGVNNDECFTSIIKQDISTFIEVRLLDSSLAVAEHMKNALRLQ